MKSKSLINFEEVIEHMNKGKKRTASKKKKKRRSVNKR
jgi:hypothetical protein